MEKLLVFIPAYNCEKQVTRVLSQLLDQRIAPWVGECIVVNNRSADGTEAAVQDWMARHPDAPVRLLRNDQNYGLGGSHKVAFGYAAAHGYEHLVVLHGDDQGAIVDLLPILEEENADAEQFPVGELRLTTFDNTDGTALYGGFSSGNNTVWTVPVSYTHLTLPTIEPV